MMFTVVGVGVGVGVALLGLGEGDVEVFDGLALVDGGLLDAELLVASLEGKRMPCCVRKKPTSANRTSKIRAMRGQVQGLRPRRSGSSAGSSP
jgi:hypothetical protein